jgi:hypothetical protein
MMLSLYSLGVGGLTNRKNKTLAEKIVEADLWSEPSVFCRDCIRLFKRLNVIIKSTSFSLKVTINSLKATQNILTKEQMKQKPERERERESVCVCVYIYVCKKGRSVQINDAEDLLNYITILELILRKEAEIKKQRERVQTERERERERERV